MPARVYVDSERYAETLRALPDAVLPVALVPPLDALLNRLRMISWLLFWFKLRVICSGFWFGWLTPMVTCSPPLLEVGHADVDLLTRSDVAEVDHDF